MIENPTDSRGKFVVRLKNGDYVVNDPSATDKTVRWWTFLTVVTSWKNEYAPTATIVQITEAERLALNESMKRCP